MIRFFCSSFICFNNTSTSVRWFSCIYVYIYRKGPLCRFQPGAPYNLNPPLGIAQAKHCNLVCCSFVLRIDWVKPFLTDHAITCGVNGLNSFVCLWRNTTIVIIGKKCISTIRNPLWRNKDAFRRRLSRDFTRTSESLTLVLAGPD